MKMKQLSTAILLAVILAGTGFSGTIANWQGAPSGDANHPEGTGLWTGPYWNNPPTNIKEPPAFPGDEIKITKPKKVCTINSNVGDYVCKLSISGGPDLATAPKLEIVDGAQLAIGEFRVGAGGSAKTGTIGCVVQAGGTLIMNDNIKLGRASTSADNPNDGKGFYSISGGTIKPAENASRAGLLVGGNGSGETPSEGTFIVTGKKASISVKKLYVGNDGYKGAGKGTLEFRLDSEGVSPIQSEGGVYLDQGQEATTTELIISAVAAPPKADIILVDNQGGSPVTGTFDTANGNPASEGAEVVVSFANNKYYYKLTYTGGEGSNDIMLTFDRQEAAAPAAAAPAEPNK
ncbi:MAG: hypothetical protein PHQ00_02280 [Phycisphaerae bacterium]|nr:hypothetical protein [Phycisphaerae bacterium]